MISARKFVVADRDCDEAMRFSVLVNGFAEGASFSSLPEAVKFVVAHGGDDVSFEIYDRLWRRYVWTRPRAQGRKRAPAKEIAPAETSSRRAACPPIDRARPSQGDVCA
jgi:hypothetical protein